MNPVRVYFLAALMLAASVSASSHAADGTWLSTVSGGFWSDSANWTTSTIADGTGSTANFSAVDIVTDPFVVHLDSGRTIGSMIFGDTVLGTPASWLLDNNGDTSNTLLFDGTSAITVNALGAGKSATISAGLSGSAGLTKSGPGTLILTGSNNYSGTTTVSAGTLQFGDGSNGFAGPGPYTIASGATLSLFYAAATTPPWSALSGAGTFELNSAQGGTTGAANWFTPNIPAAFTGTVKLDCGRIDCPPTGLNATTNLILADGAQFLAFNGTYNGAAFTYPQNITMKGMGWGELNYNDGALRVSGLNATFTGTITLTGNSGMFTQLSTSSTININNVISDGGNGYGIIYAPRGLTINLLGANTYSGPTSVLVGAASTLQLKNTLALQNSTLTTGSTGLDSIQS